MCFKTPWYHHNELNYIGKSHSLHLQRETTAWGKYVCSLRMEEDQSSCGLARRQDLEALLWFLYSLQCSEAADLPLFFSPEGQCSITVLYCCSSSHSWLCCNSAGQWKVQFPLCLPNLWPIVGCVLGKNGFSLGERKLQTAEIY